MDVAAWLRDLRLEAYAEAFAENGADADLLGELTVANAARPLRRR